MNFTKTTLQREVLALSNSDGGVSGIKNCNSDPLTTAQFIVLCISNSFLKETDEKIIEACRYLMKHQKPDGHWERNIDTWHTSITAWCVKALIIVNLTTYQKVIIKATKWLIERQDINGGFYESESIKMPNTYSTSNVCCILNYFSQYHKELENALKWLIKVQELDGGFKDYCAIQKNSEPSLSSYVVHGIHEINLPIVDIILSNIFEYLSCCQRSTGAWSAWYEDTDSIEGTSASIRALKISKKYSQNIKLGISFISSNLSNKNLDNWELISLAYLYDYAPQ